HPDLFRDGERDRLLGAVKDVPEDHGAEKKENGGGQRHLLQVAGEESPDEKVHDRPEQDPHDARGAAAVEVEVAQQEPGESNQHAQRPELAAVSRISPSRAMAMKTSSSVAPWAL